ncbi:MAG: anthranilate synthase component I [Anaerolineae bacterium]|nr:anthranilate synthase component I [Anaerolineae bacterium]
MTAAPVTFRATPRPLYSPSFEQTAQYFEQGNLVPVYRALAADLETPVSVFLKLAREDEPAFLLESVEGGETVARYSFLGIDPICILSVKDGQLREQRGDQVTTRQLAQSEDALAVIKQEIDRYKPVAVPGLPRFTGGAVGFLSYDYVRQVENLPTTARDELNLADASFMVARTLVMFDHVKHQILVLSNAHNDGDPRDAYGKAVARIESIVDRLRAPLPAIPQPGGRVDTTMSSNLTQEEFEAGVRKAKEYIAAGDAFQVVTSQRFTRETSAHPFAIYRSLRMLNPSPYMFFLRFPVEDGQTEPLHVIGASPEMMVRYEADSRAAVVRPIAGTAPRGTTPQEDDANAEHMINDPKERAEHVMLVDLGRNDLGRVCDYGTVKVSEMMVIEKYSHVMHIVSHVVGTLRKDMDAYSLVRATFPAGTLSGAPKIRAMEIIEEIEGVRRGVYGGAVGYFSYGGSMDFCIAIRTLVMRGKRIYVQAGAGLVADSDPTKEYQESINKARAVAIAIENAETGMM